MYLTDANAGQKTAAIAGHAAFRGVYASISIGVVVPMRVCKFILLEVVNVTHPGFCRMLLETVSMIAPWGFRILNLVQDGFILSGASRPS